MEDARSHTENLQTQGFPMEWKEGKVSKAFVGGRNTGTADVKKGPYLIVGAPSNPVSSVVPSPAPLNLPS